MVLMSRCDSSGRLGIPDTFALFMDVATEHAHMLRVGIGEIGKKNLFWLAVRTKIKFYCRPALEEKVTLVTFPEKPKGVRSNRDYGVYQGDELLIEGKNEWTVMNTETKKLVRGDDVYPDGIDYESELLCGEPFARVRDDFDGCAVFASYRVRSTDIDIGGHMNNTAYPKAIAGLFSNEEMNAFDVREIDVRFVNPCYEGEEMLFQKRRAEDGALEIRAHVKSGADERTVLLVKVN